MSKIVPGAKVYCYGDPDLAQAINASGHEVVSNVDFDDVKAVDYAIIVARELKPHEVAIVGYWSGRGRKVLVLTRVSTDSSAVYSLPRVTVKKTETLGGAQEAARSFLPWPCETYTDYLKTPQWAARRVEALERADNRCQVCYSSIDLAVHHRTYLRLGKERDMDLTVLCKVCHRKYHDIRDEND